MIDEIVKKYKEWKLRHPAKDHYSDDELWDFVNMLTNEEAHLLLEFGRSWKSKDNSHTVLKIKKEDIDKY